jgi:23S rRNA (uracil1939-C5)-methyltransferase
VTPPCPAVALGCGGCDLQHLAVAGQTEAKATIVADALAHLGRIRDAPVEIGPPLPTQGFRTTVRAAVVGDRAGFRRHRSHDVVVPDHCLVAHPLVDELLVAGRFPGATQVTLRLGEGTGERLALVEPTAEGAQLPDDVLVVGADALAGGRRAWIHERAAGRVWRVSARSFFQSRTDGAEPLVAAVARAVGGAAAGARVVDAYAGVGLLGGSLLDAGARSVTALERSASSVADARVNLADDAAHVVKVDVARWRPRAADVVVADPARHGLGSAVASLTATGAGTFVLVACDAGALGRDTRLLTEAGYRLEQVEVLDLFPHSHHIEAVACFRR